MCVRPEASWRKFNLCLPNFHPRKIFILLLLPVLFSPNFAVHSLVPISFVTSVTSLYPRNRFATSQAGEELVFLTIALLSSRYRRGYFKYIIASREKFVRWKIGEKYEGRDILRKSANHFVWSVSAVSLRAFLKVYKTQAVSFCRVRRYLYNYRWGLEKRGKQ